MALDDVYRQRAWSPNEEVNARVDQGLGSVGAAYQQFQEQYSNPFKQALERMMAGDDPAQVAADTKAHMAGGMGEHRAPQAPPAPQAGSAFGSSAGAMMSNPPQAPTAPMSMSTPRMGFGQGMPQPSTQPSQQAQSAFAEPPQHTPVQAPPQQTGNFGPAPQRGGAGDFTGAIRTNADVRGALSLMPYAQVRQSDRLRITSKPVNDPMALERLKQEGRLGLEDRRQEGRMTIVDAKLAQRQLEQDALNAYRSGVLTEREFNHVEMIKLGYARLASMEHLLDKNINWKRESGADDKLKTARTVVDSLTASRAGLVGSAFASTPEGQRTLGNLDNTLGIWSNVLNQYATQPPPGGGVTRTQGGMQQSGGSQRTPAGVQGPTIVPAPKAGPAPVKPPQAKDQDTPPIPLATGKTKAGATVYKARINGKWYSTPEEAERN